MAPAVDAGFVPDATVRLTSEVVQGGLASLSHCRLTVRRESSRKSGKHDKYVGSVGAPPSAVPSSRSRLAMAIPFTASRKSPTHHPAPALHSHIHTYER